MSKGKNAKYVPVKQSNTMTYVLGGIAVLVVIVVVIGGVLLMSKKEGTPADQVTSKLDAATPVMVLGKSDAPTTLDFFEDPMCPACGQLERSYGEQIVKGIEDGKIKARYHMLSFLNQQSSSGDYSDRANGSFIAISKSSLTDDQKQKALLGAHTALFANQPSEGKQNPDHDNAKIASIVADGAKTKGVELPADVTSAISEGKYTAEAATNAATNSTLLSDVGGTGTPTVIEGGKIVETQGDWLTKILS